MAKKTEPALEPIGDAVLEPASAEDCIKALISALGHDPATVGTVEVTRQYVRIVGKDRSMRSHKVDEWNAVEEDETDGD